MNHPGIVSAEAVGISILLILLYAMAFESNIRTKRDKAYQTSLLLITGGSVADLLFHVAEGHANLQFLLSMLKLLSISLDNWMIMSFLYYFVCMLEEKQFVSPWLAQGPAMTVGFITVIDCVTSLSGQLFSIRDGFCVYGPLYSVHAVFRFLLILYMCILAIRYIRVIGSHDAGTLFAFLIIVAVTGLLPQFAPVAELNFVGSAVSALLIYILMQSTSMREAALREKVLVEVSRTDELTGLPNRRAADEAIESYGKEGGVGVAFFDVNGLKYTNDTCGHAAGDRLLQRFTRLLCECFRHNELYRISGDEFLLISGPLPESVFSERMNRVLEKIDQTGQIAAVGYVYGQAADVSELIREAEKLMYADKERCHGLHPEWVRK